MKTHHTKLRFEEREQIAILKAKGNSLRQIARLLGRSHSTLSRELKRNATPIYRKPWYLASHAQDNARKRKVLAGKRDRLKNPRIRNYVTRKLKLLWSPEIIAGRIRIDLPNCAISHEAIYQYVYEEAWHLFPFLVRKHKRRRLRFNFRKTHYAAIPSRIFIHQRPQVINQRLEFGHWEADSMVSRANSVSLHALLERKSRYLKITKILRNSSECVQNAILRRLAPLNPSLRQSITYDNGPENSNHLHINRELHSQSYFCNPYHSWEKGSVENAIGLIRRFVPKKTNLERIPSSEISQIQNLINNRPRKCLNYQTPREVFETLSGAIPG